MNPMSVLVADGEIRLSTRKIKAIINDPQKSAEAVDLVYVNDQQPGICRVRKGEEFHYFSGRKKIRDPNVLDRIKRLAIPPAWENVWICSVSNGHLQATGTDTKNRKQYKYHTQWGALRNHTKFFRVLHFGRSISALRQRLEQDLSRPGLPMEKVLAAVVCLMDQAGFRVGNGAYEKLYGSFGLTTLKDQHVKISGNLMQFMFVGKKGISHNISIKNKRLAKIVKSCRDIPGKELFQYYDAEGNRHSVDSGMVNAYIKSATGEDFTAKDFRTWAGTVRALAALRELGMSETVTENKKNVLMALDCVALHLGNTRTVCKKYYVHPIILTLYEENRLHTFLTTEVQCPEGIDPHEYIVLTILEREYLTSGR
jgi:DNA topoisomerase I